MDFLLSYLFFGPIVAIPIGITKMAWAEMLTQGLFAQLAELTAIHFVLQSTNYPATHRRALVEKFALVTNKKIIDVKKNTERLEALFYKEFGHFGYYLSLIFFSFTLGVTWSAAIAFALRLKTTFSAVFIIIGSVMGFAFWYWAIEQSLDYMATDVSFILAIVLSIFLLFYGQIREKHILHKVKKKLKK